MNIAENRSFQELFDAFKDAVRSLDAPEIV